MTAAAFFARQLFATYKGQTVPVAAIERVAMSRTSTVIGLLECAGVTADASGQFYTFPAA